MKYRIAKRCDLDHIVDLHLKVREVYDIGFFSKMGRSFLKKYYQINIDDPNEIILCAESDNGTICGFCSGREIQTSCPRCSSSCSPLH